MICLTNKIGLLSTTHNLKTCGFPCNLNMNTKNNENKDKVDLLINEIVEKLTDYTYTLRDMYGNVTNGLIIDDIELCGGSNLRKEIKEIINKYINNIS